MPPTPANLPLTLLSQARIASPCPARWEDMAGDDRRRFCAQCGLHVHNISAMSAAEAETLLTAAAGDGEARLCAQIHRRADGTILTRDCPVGLARIRAAARRTLGRIAAAFALLTGLSVAAAWVNRTEWGPAVRLRALEPLATLSKIMAPRSLPATFGPPIRGEVLLGKVAPTTPRPPAVHIPTIQPTVRPPAPSANQGNP